MRRRMVWGVLGIGCLLVACAAMGGVETNQIAQIPGCTTSLLGLVGFALCSRRAGEL